ncbi:accessory Sec-dependent serine-rich glycoprotein adhesin [Streptococcus hyointestinalis]|uniref:accessory Sec-dependent serine-rich glycoprotein adhesin n=1 Tax=Streptococcus hyointestinalis TaxID=1337 RepID=UPI0024065F4B|nr:accessory Sec-dependent serine-rich glycoprotein adhesin [Streptococcus hyointestinalis]
MSSIGLIHLFKGISSKEIIVSENEGINYHLSLSRNILKGAATLSAIAAGGVTGTAMADTEERAVTLAADSVKATDNLSTTDVVTLPSNNDSTTLKTQPLSVTEIVENVSESDFTFMSASISESVSESISESISESVSTSESMSLSLSESTSESVSASESLYQSTSESVSVSESVSESVRIIANTSESQCDSEVVSSERETEKIDEKSLKGELTETKEELYTTLNEVVATDTSFMTETERIEYEEVKREARNLLNQLDNFLATATITQSRYDNLSRRANVLAKKLQEVIAQ